MARGKKKRNTLEKAFAELDIDIEAKPRSSKMKIRVKTQAKKGKGKKKSSSPEVDGAVVVQNLIAAPYVDQQTASSSALARGESWGKLEQRQQQQQPQPRAGPGGGGGGGGGRARRERPRSAPGGGHRFSRATLTTKATVGSGGAAAAATEAAGAALDLEAERLWGPWATRMRGSDMLDVQRERANLLRMHFPDKVRWLDYLISTHRRIVKEEKKNKVVAALRARLALLQKGYAVRCKALERRLTEEARAFEFDLDREHARLGKRHAAEQRALVEEAVARVAGACRCARRHLCRHNAVPLKEFRPSPRVLHLRRNAERLVREGFPEDAQADAEAADALERQERRAYLERLKGRVAGGAPGAGVGATATKGPGPLEPRPLLDRLVAQHAKEMQDWATGADTRAKKLASSHQRQREALEVQLAKEGEAVKRHAREVAVSLGVDKNMVRSVMETQVPTSMEAIKASMVELRNANARESSDNSLAPGPASSLALLRLSQRLLTSPRHGGGGGGGPQISPLRRAASLPEQPSPPPGERPPRRGGGGRGTSPRAAAAAAAAPPAAAAAAAGPGGSRPAPPAGPGRGAGSRPSPRKAASLQNVLLAGGKRKAWSGADEEPAGTGAGILGLAPGGGGGAAPPATDAAAAAAAAAEAMEESWQSDLTELMTYPGHPALAPTHQRPPSPSGGGGGGNGGGGGGGGEGTLEEAGAAALGVPSRGEVRRHAAWVQAKFLCLLWAVEAKDSFQDLLASPLFARRFREYCSANEARGILDFYVAAAPLDAAAGHPPGGPPLPPGGRHALAARLARKFWGDSPPAAPADELVPFLMHKRGEAFAHLYCSLFPSFLAAPDTLADVADHLLRRGDRELLGTDWLAAFAQVAPRLPGWGNCAAVAAGAAPHALRYASPALLLRAALGGGGGGGEEAGGGGALLGEVLAGLGPGPREQAEEALREGKTLYLRAPLPAAGGSGEGGGRAAATPAATAEEEEEEEEEHLVFLAPVHGLDSAHRRAAAAARHKRRRQPRGGGGGGSGPGAAGAGAAPPPPPPDHWLLLAAPTAAFAGGEMELLALVDLLHFLPLDPPPPAAAAPSSSSSSRPPAPPAKNGNAGGAASPRSGRLDHFRRFKMAMELGGVVC